MLTFIKELRFAGSFFQFAKDPTHTDRVFEMIKTGLDISNPESLGAIVYYMLKDPVLKTQFEQNYYPRRFTEQHLAQCKKGSVGNTLWKHFSENGLDYDFYPELKVTSPITYLTYRMYQVHDLWHVLTEYDVS